jgi:hypothetical protein
MPPDEQYPPSTPEIAAALHAASGAEWVHLWRQLQQRADSGPHLAAIIRDTSRLRHQALSTLTRTDFPDVMDALVEALSDERRAVTRLALARLGDSGAEAAVEPVLAMLGPDQPPDVRGEAVRALAKIGSQRAIGAITNSLRDPDPGVREAAVAALSASSAPSVRSALATALEDESPAVRARAAGALTRASGADAIPPLTDRPELTLPGSWYSDPLIHAESQIYTFRPDATGEVEDINMGLVNDRRSFTYRQDADVLEFRFGGESQPRRTRFKLEHGSFAHPYQGDRPCVLLIFSHEPYFTTFAPPGDVPYYRLPEDG